MRRRSLGPPSVLLAAIFFGLLAAVLPGLLERDQERASAALLLVLLVYAAVGLAILGTLSKEFCVPETSH